MDLAVEDMNYHQPWVEVVVDSLHTVEDKEEVGRSHAYRIDLDNMTLGIGKKRWTGPWPEIEFPFVALTAAHWQSCSLQAVLRCDTLKANKHMPSDGPPLKKGAFETQGPFYLRSTTGRKFYLRIFLQSNTA